MHPQNVNAHHKPSPPRVVLRLPESLKGKLTCRSSSENSKVTPAHLTAHGFHPYQVPRTLTTFVSEETPCSIIVHKTRLSFCC